MKKLRLDDLRVDSFATGPVSRGEGTVRAHLPGSGPSYDQPCVPIDPDYPDADGMAVDEEGTVWITGYKSDALTLLNPDGSLKGNVGLPGGGARPGALGADRGPRSPRPARLDPGVLPRGVRPHSQGE